jgi:hypothetical protein
MHKVNLILSIQPSPESEAKEKRNKDTDNFLCHGMQ